MSDLRQEAEYLAERNPRAARRAVGRIQEAVRLLAELPGLGRPGRVPGTRELVVGRTPYIIPYRVREDHVEILRVLHSSRRWPKRF